MHLLLPWERLLWESRSWRSPRIRYVLTDLRLVGLEGSTSWEIALQDIHDVLVRTDRLDRLIGTSTLVVVPRWPNQPRLALAGVRRGTQLAALLEVLASEAAPALDAVGVRAVLAWSPRWESGRTGRAAAAVLILATGLSAIAVGLRGEAAIIAYPSADAIYPDGVKRDREAIVRFMETEVLPWARTALGPIVGGADRVTCATCHGTDPEQRNWQMPGVVALPEPHVRPIGTHDTEHIVDAQMRNAIYGYLAESDNQAKAAYMREVIVPGMARLLNRPAYDFTKPYEYNRTRFAIGCYHCHKVSEPPAAEHLPSAG